MLIESSDVLIELCCSSCQGYKTYLYHQADNFRAQHFFLSCLCVLLVLLFNTVIYFFCCFACGGPSKERG